MKRIVLVRHATAVRKDPDRSDFSRSLKKSGRKEARVMAQRVRNLDVPPSLMVSSPADRALETAHVFADILGYPREGIVEWRELYDGLTPSAFLRMVKGLDNDHDTAMFFGHDPTFTEICNYTLRDFEGSVPKCGVVAIGFHAAAWRHVSRAGAQKEYFIYPAELPSEKVLQKALRRDLETVIERNLDRTLARLGIDRSKDVRKRLKRLSAKLARKIAPAARIGSSSMSDVSDEGDPEEKQA
jgi:phosphohistidine phosphatase